MYKQINDLYAVRMNLTETSLGKLFVSCGLSMKKKTKGNNRTKTKINLNALYK